MNFEFKYEMAVAPAASNDGSGVVKHDIWKVYREAGTQDAFVHTDRHKTICVPHAQVTAAIAISGAAYKAALHANVNTQPVSNRDWSDAKTAEFLNTNVAALAAAVAANTFITVDLGKTYPFDF